MYSIQLRTNNHRSVKLNKESIDLFRTQLRGKVFLPDDYAFHDIYKIWNGMIDRKPGLVVRCQGVSDVIEAVKFARTFKIEIAIKSGGHGVAGYALVEGGMVIDLSEMKGIRVDPLQKTVRADAGVTLGELDHETQTFGLATPLGIVSDTGIAGLTLGGGIGWLSRKYGLTIDNLLTVDLVTAEGRLLKASAQENQDLFWAIKGGGGNFGIVTSFEYKLHPVGPDVWTLYTVYPLEKANTIMDFVKEYMAKAPEELGLITIFCTMASKAEYPQAMYGKPIILLLGCYHGPFEKGEEVIQPLREIDTPVFDASMPMKFAEFQSALDGDYPPGQDYYWKSLFMPEPTTEIIHILQRAVEQSPSRASTLDFWSLGGAVSRVGMRDTPFALRQAPFLLGIEANWDDVDKTTVNVDWAKGVARDMQPFAYNGFYLNFPGLGEEREHMLRGTFGDNYRRLMEIKTKYDPFNLFHNNVNIPVL